MRCLCRISYIEGIVWKETRDILASYPLGPGFILACNPFCRESHFHPQCSPSRLVDLDLGCTSEHCLNHPGTAFQLEQIIRDHGQVDFRGLKQRLETLYIVFCTEIIHSTSIRQIQSSQYSPIGRILGNKRTPSQASCDSSSAAAFFFFSFFSRRGFVDSSLSSSSSSSFSVLTSSGLYHKGGWVSRRGPAGSRAIVKWNPATNVFGGV